MPRKPRPVTERMMGLAERQAPLPGQSIGCLIWKGKVNERGYGYIRVGPRMRRVHRVAYEAEYGPLAPGVQVCHRCDTPACLEAKHLFSCNDVSNALDREQKGRGGRTKLKPSDVRTMRDMYSHGASVGQLSYAFDVDRTTAKRAVLGKTFAWL